MGPSDTVLAALRIMAANDIGFVVVLQQATLVGVLSERDCARRVLLAGRRADSTPVSEVMTKDVVTPDLTHTFADCLRLMYEQAVRHLPVVDGNKVIAVISIPDLLSEAVAHHAKIIADLERERLNILPQWREF